MVRQWASGQDHWFTTSAPTECAADAPPPWPTTNWCFQLMSDTCIQDVRKTSVAGFVPSSRLFAGRAVIWLLQRPSFTWAWAICYWKHSHLRRSINNTGHPIDKSKGWRIACLSNNWYFTLCLLVAGITNIDCSNAPGFMILWPNSDTDILINRNTCTCCTRCIFERERSSVAENVDHFHRQDGAALSPTPIL